MRFPGTIKGDISGADDQDDKLFSAISLFPSKQHPIGLTLPPTWKPSKGLKCKMLLGNAEIRHLIEYPLVGNVFIF